MSDPHDKIDSHDKKVSDDHDEKVPSNKELLESAKLVADAAKCAMNKDTANMDKGKVAGAAADLLGAASHYGKFQDGAMGKYLHQAEDYLDKYAEKEAANHKDPAKNKVNDSDDQSPKPIHDEDKKHEKSDHKDKKDKKDKKDDDDDDDEKSGGFGDYLKMGKDFLGKHKN